MQFLLQSLFFSILIGTSCLQAAQSAPATLQAPLSFEAHQEKLLLNPAQRRFQFSATATGDDLWNRTMWGMAAGAITGFTLVASGPRLKPSDANLICFCGLTVPMLCLTFIPGSTKYDHNGIADWFLISLGRNTVVGIGAVMGVIAGAIPAALFATR